MTRAPAPGLTPDSRITPDPRPEIVTTANTFIFVGPTAHGTDLTSLLTPGEVTLPPVRRGDIDTLTTTADQPGTIVLIDGTFHSYPAVGHREIREAMDAGWAVWGLCSMGAIRAAEMDTLGMRGFGRAYSLYRDRPDFADDEVALIHEEEHPYRPLSEPLLHIREALDHLRSATALSAAEHLSLLDSYKSRWFGHRQLPALRRDIAKLPSQNSDTTAVVEEAFAHFDRFRVKKSDLLSFLTNRPWEGAHEQ